MTRHAVLETLVRKHGLKPVLDDLVKICKLGSARFASDEPETARQYDRARIAIRSLVKQESLR